MGILVPDAPVAAADVSPSRWGSASKPDITLVNLITENVDGARWLPTGGLYVASALEAAGHAVEFRDFQLFDAPDPYRPEVVAEYLLQSRAPVLGIGLMIDMLPLTLAAVTLVKQRRPELTIVLGGPGPSNLHEQILSRYPAVDVIVRGEGELTAVDLLGALRRGGDLSAVHGVAFRGADGGVCATPPRPRNKELTDLPRPAYHCVDTAAYGTYGVLFSRGCIFKCEFCEIPWIWQHTVQRRLIDDIVSELIELRDRFGVRRVEILDDLFVSNRRWTREFCQAMIRHRVGINWSCFGYISLMTEELMELMAEAGCDGIFYGVETGSQRMIRDTGKKFTVEQARQTVLTTTKYMRPCSSFIWNYPYETLDDFYDTIAEFVYLNNKGSNVRLFMLSPLKPTPFAGPQYAAQLRFDEDIWCHLLRRRRYIHVADMIRDDPDLFCAFYHFETEGLEKKLGIVQNLIRLQE